MKVVTNNCEDNKNWKSISGFIWSSASVAIGLGNIWRFPYLCSKYGGISFIVAYVLVLFLATIPAIILEIGIAKNLQTANIGCYSYALNNRAAGVVVGLITAGSAFIVNFTYMVTTGYCGVYAAAAIAGGWYRSDVVKFYQAIIDKKWIGLLSGIVVLIITTIIAMKEIAILEKVCRILVPVIGIILFALFIWSLSLPNIAKGYIRLENFEFEWWIDYEFWLTVFGQVMFSVGLGPGLFLTFGSRLSKDSNIVVGAIGVALADTVVSIFAAFVIVPTLACFGFEDNYGLDLAFLVYPSIFSQIEHGYILGLLFFSLLFLAALSSCVGHITIFLTTIIDEYHLNRKKTCIVLALVTLGGMAPCLYNKVVNDLVSQWICDYILNTTALISIISFGWIYGVKKIRTQHINKGRNKIGGWFDWLIRLISTPILLMIIVSMFMQIIN